MTEQQAEEASVDDTPKPSYAVMMFEGGSLTASPEINWELPPHGSILACPKCGASGDGVRVEHHGQVVLSEPCGRMLINRTGRVTGWSDFPEHLCRTCTRCHYGWPEGVVSGL